MKLEPTLAKASRETFWAQAYGNEDRSSNSVHDGKARGGERQTGGRERQVSEGCVQQSAICQLAAHS